MKRTPLRRKSKSPTTVIKDEIQALVRQIVIKRDGGCILRHHPQSGQCGGHRQDGELILQGEHLVTRSNSASFGDTRNIVCLCKRHHIFFKPQHSQIYWEIIEKHLGKAGWERFKMIRDDRTPQKIDWKLTKLALEQELKTYEE